MMPRLKQPLFHPEHYGEIKHGVLKDFIRAYDCIWTLVYRPLDIPEHHRLSNARANLQRLGSVIEAKCSQCVFDADLRQLTFPDEILDEPASDNETSRQRLGSDSTY